MILLAQRKLHWFVVAACVAARPRLLPAGIGQLYMHEKMLLADGVTLTIGSQNPSTAGLLEDRVLSLRLSKGAAGPVIEAVESTFDHD